MTVNFEYTTIPELISHLGATMGAEVTKDYAEFVLHLPPSWGKGMITGFDYGTGLNLLLFNCQFVEEFHLEYTGSGIYPAHLLFCHEGSLRHIFNYGKMNYQLDPLMGSITANVKASRESFHFPSKTQIFVTNLEIDRIKYFHRLEGELPSISKPLAKMFADREAEEAFFYHSNYNLAIEDCINSIRLANYSGLIHSLFLESKILELLAMQIKQYEDDIRQPGRRVSLKQQDADKILKARDLLIQDLSKTVTIPELAKMAGINRQKLKSGFKIIFNKTISNYLLEERMIKARLLLASGTLTVGDISSIVGYTNQSHFSRRFREKFGILPKEYLKKVQARIID